MRYLLSALLLFSGLCVFAKDPQVIEEEMVACVKRINYWRTNPNTELNVKNFDSLYFENNRLKALILGYGMSDPITISYPFDSLRKYIDVASSDDNKFRIYSWHIGQYDKMEYFVNIFQYEAQGNYYTMMINYDDEYDPKGYYSEIKTLNCGTDTAIYMGYFHAFYSPKDFCDSYQTFMVEGNQLQDSIPIFKIKDDSIAGTIDVLFLPASQKNSMKRLIFYNAKKKRIKIRQTDNFGIILNKFRKLVFNGKHFEYQD